jgi:hypothetical protein
MKRDRCVTAKKCQSVTVKRKYSGAFKTAVTDVTAFFICTQPEFVQPEIENFLFLNFVF